MSKGTKKTAISVVMGAVAGVLVVAAAVTVRVFSHSNNIFVKAASISDSALAIALVFPRLKNKNDELLAAEDLSTTGQTSSRVEGKAWYAGIFAGLGAFTFYNAYSYLTKIDNPWINKALFAVAGIITVAHIGNEYYNPTPVPKNGYEPLNNELSWINLN